MSRRATASYRNSLRPVLVTQSIIAGVIIAGIGISYAWIGWKKQQRADQMRTTGDNIDRLVRQLQAKDSEMGELLAGARLRQRVESMKLGLQDIGSARSLVTVGGTDAETFHLVTNEK